MKLMKFGCLILLAVINFISPSQAKTFWVEKEILRPDDPYRGDFGESVCISGDYAIVGSEKDVRDEKILGAAYIFKHQGDSWVQQAKLIASDAAADDNFGCSVAIDGDYAVVGADEDDDGYDAAGSAYVFKRVGDTWSQVAKLHAFDPNTRDHFGTSVAISGTKIVVGAPIVTGYGFYGDDPGGTGVVYVFSYNGSIWIEEQKLVPSDAEDYWWLNHMCFGRSVSIYNEMVLVGAWHIEASYVFEKTATEWIEIQKLVANDGNDYDNFGWSVSIGNGELIIGAWGDDNEAPDSGSAYIFEYNGSQWMQKVKLLPRHSIEGCEFGYSVSISDGTAVVGSAHAYDEGAFGSVGVFKKNGSGLWEQEDGLTARDAENLGRFGLSVSIDGNSAVIGTWNAVASAYIFEKSATPPLPYDNFNDNDQSTLWYKYADNPNGCWVDEVNERLEVGANISAASEVAVYVSNRWKLDATQDFSLRADFFHNTSDPVHSWVMLMLTPDFANAEIYRIHAGAGSYMEQAYYDYTVVNGTNVNNDFISGRMDSGGVIYVSYDAGLDELYLSFDGYGSSNAWWTIPNVLGGQWGHAPLHICIGGGAENIIITSGDVYLDNFAVDSGNLTNWPPIGDLDHDGDSDLVDLSEFTEMWLRFDCGMCQGADLNMDQDVDLLDFAAFAENWLVGVEP